MKGDITETVIERLEKLQKDILDLQDFTIRARNFSSNIEAATFKVEIISMTADQSEFNNDLTKKRISDMVNHTWIKSEGIEWIEDDLAKKRNDKIEQILK